MGEDICSLIARNGNSLAGIDFFGLFSPLAEACLMSEHSTWGYVPQDWAPGAVGRDLTLWDSGSSNIYFC